ncbi:MAG: class I adenylate-forming enzyme family protein [Alphaproteobacteria bacterium]
MTIGATLATAAAAYPDKPAFIGSDRTFSFAEADSLANRFANALITRGINPGETVALIGHNSVDYAIAYFGIARAGAASLHLSARMTPEEIRHCLDAGGTRTVVCGPEIAASAGLENTIPLGGDGLTGLLGEQDDTDPMREGSIDAPSSASYTGGTTGFPKGGMHTARSRLTWATIAHEFFALTADEVMAVAAPMGHAAGGFIWFQPGVCAAATQVILPGWNVPEFMAATEIHGVTATFLVPAQIHMLIEHPDFDPGRLSNLRKIVYGGAPAPAGLIERADALLPGCEFIQNYGMTEIGPLVTLYKADRDKYPDAIGHPTGHTECAIFTAPGEEAATGQIGELCFRGPTLMQGYVGDTEQTDEFFRTGDGWGWTGDLAVRNEDGVIALVGRSKDVVISGGLNVYPAEIERVLIDIPGVKECAVFGLPDETFGELPAVAIVADREMTADELLAACGDRIARHKRPRRVEFMDTLPKSPAGKVLRTELKKLYS